MTQTTKEISDPSGGTASTRTSKLQWCYFGIGPSAGAVRARVVYLTVAALCTYVTDMLRFAQQRYYTFREAYYYSRGACYSLAVA